MIYDVCVGAPFRFFTVLLFVLLLLLFCITRMGTLGLGLMVLEWTGVWEAGVLEGSFYIPSPLLEYYVIMNDLRNIT